MKHPFFFARTVLVKENNLEEAAAVLNRILGRENILKEIKLIERYEKPWKTRKRLSVERCTAIYAEDARRRSEFLLRKDREPPYPGCY